MSAGYIPPAQRHIRTRLLCGECADQPCEWHLYACRRIVSPMSTCEYRGAGEGVGRQDGAA